MWFLQLMDFLGRREEGERCSAKGGRQGGAAHRRTGARDLRGVVLVHVSGAIPLQEVANLRGRCVRDRLEAGALADTAQAPRPSPDRATADPRLGRRRGCGGGYGLGRGPECTFWLVSSMLRARVGCTSSSSSSSPPSSFCPRAGTEADERVRPPCPASDARACQGLSDQAVEGTIRDLMELVPFHWRRVPGRARASSSARTAPQRGHPRGLAGMVWSEWSAPARDQLRLVVVWIQ